MIIGTAGDEGGGGSIELLAHRIGYGRRCRLSLVSQSLSLTACGK